MFFNAHKTEYMCLNKTGDISTLGGSSLKQVDKFTYPRSSVSLNEKDIDTRLAKAWTADEFCWLVLRATSRILTELLYVG